jgi:hypothetical protein
MVPATCTARTKVGTRSWVIESCSAGGRSVLAFRQIKIPRTRLAEVNITAEVPIRE